MNADPALADRQLVDVRRRRDEADCRRHEQVDAVECLLAALAVLGALRASRGLDLSSVTARQRSSLVRTLSPYRSCVLGEERAVDVGDLAHEEAVSSPASGKSIARRRGNRAAAASTRARTSGSACVEPRDADFDLLQRLESRRSKAGHERVHQLLAALDRRRHRPDVVVARRKREAAVRRDEVVRRLEADDAAPGGRDPDRAARVGAESELDVAGGDRRRRAAARAAGEATRARRVRHCRRSAGSRRDPVRELVQVRLARDGVAGRLQPQDRLGALRGTWSANRTDPYVVTRPAVSSRSFTATGVPARRRPRKPHSVERRHGADSTRRASCAPRPASSRRSSSSSWLGGFVGLVGRSFAVVLRQAPVRDSRSPPALDAVAPIGASVSGSRPRREAERGTERPKDSVNAWCRCPRRDRFAPSGRSPSVTFIVPRRRGDCDVQRRVGPSHVVTFGLEEARCSARRERGCGRSPGRTGSPGQAGRRRLQAS